MTINYTKVFRTAGAVAIAASPLGPEVSIGFGVTAVLAGIAVEGFSTKWTRRFRKRKAEVIPLKIGRPRAHETPE